MILLLMILVLMQQPRVLAQPQERPPQAPQVAQEQPPQQRAEQPPAPPQRPERRARPGQAPSAMPRDTTAPPVAGNIDETPSVTRHEITFGGKKLAYTATVAQMPIMDSNGETEAHIFYMAYTLDGVADAAKRPLTFAFNGGPGSASLWVHMGGMGPRRAKLLDDGTMPPPPFQLVDNEDTWLEATDLVFIDPVGTGYSRAMTMEAARKFNGVQGDIQSVGEFIRTYLNRNTRYLSPLFLAGESYGTFRSAGVAGYLIDQGIAFSGVTLISTILQYQTHRFNPGNDTPYPLFLPTYTADAWYHKKLAPELQKDLKATLKEVEEWALTGYMHALAQGDRLKPDERKGVIAKLARYTGLDPEYIDHSNLRIDVAHFTRELLRDQRLTIGRLDGRIAGPSPLDAGERAEFDPSSTIIRPPFQATFENYIRTELGYKTDLLYHVSGGTLPWDYGLENAYSSTSDLLRNAFAKNPHLKLLVMQGYYDLATPYFAAEYEINHMGIHPSVHKNISWAYYPAGHMMYIEKTSRKKFKDDISAFIRGATQP